MSFAYDLFYGAFVTFMSILHAITENVLGPKALVAIHEDYLWVFVLLMFAFWWIV